MSTPPKNIEKILLGAGIVVGGGLAALGFLKLGAASEDFTAGNPRLTESDTSVEAAEAVSRTINSLQSDREPTAATVPSERLTGGSRSVDLFVGVPLYADRDNPNEPVDLAVSPDVHPRIPNPWWIESGASPNFADSPERDDDGDGFTNIEEYQAGTDPTASDDHPRLVAKLSYIRDESFEWLVEFGLQSGDEWLPKAESVVDGDVVKSKVGYGDGLEEGDMFFEEGPLAGRFKFLRIEEREVRNERMNIDQNVKFGVFEEQKENKKGDVYEIPNRMFDAERADFIQYDRTAVLELQAIGESGNEFMVEERTRFSLPEGGEDKEYFLAEVTPEQIVVEWDEDGETESVTIPKGGLPDYDFTRER